MDNGIDNSKPFWKSRTIWFNVLSGLIAIVTTLESDKGIPPNITAIFSMVVMVGNVALRFISSGEVTATQK